MSHTADTYDFSAPFGLLDVDINGTPPGPRASTSATPGYGSGASGTGYGSPEATFSPENFMMQLPKPQNTGGRLPGGNSVYHRARSSTGSAVASDAILSHPLFATERSEKEFAQQMCHTLRSTIETLQDQLSFMRTAPGSGQSAQVLDQLRAENAQLRSLLATNTQVGSHAISSAPHPPQQQPPSQSSAQVERSREAYKQYKATISHTNPFGEDDTSMYWHSRDAKADYWSRGRWQGYKGWLVDEEGNEPEGPRSDEWAELKGSVMKANERAKAILRSALGLNPKAPVPNLPFEATHPEMWALAILTMEEYEPRFALCAGHWKAEAALKTSLAEASYSENKKVKEEEVSVPLPNNTALNVRNPPEIEVGRSAAGKAKVQAGKRKAVSEGPEESGSDGETTRQAAKTKSGGKKPKKAKATPQTLTSLAQELSLPTDNEESAREKSRDSSQQVGDNPLPKPAVVHMASVPSSVNGLVSALSESPFDTEADSETLKIASLLTKSKASLPDRAIVPNTDISPETKALRSKIMSYDPDIDGSYPGEETGGLWGHGQLEKWGVARALTASAEEGSAGDWICLLAATFTFLRQANAEAEAANTDSLAVSTFHRSIAVGTYDSLVKLLESISKASNVPQPGTSTSAPPKVSHAAKATAPADASAREGSTSADEESVPEADDATTQQKPAKKGKISMEIDDSTDRAIRAAALDDSKSAFAQFKKAQLELFLKVNGLHKTGKKTVLVDRIRAFVRS